MKALKLSGSVLAVSAATLVSAAAMAQDIIPFEYPENINVIGLGILSAPDYYGSDKNDGVAAPIARYNFSGGRYIQLLGAELELNLVDRKDFRAGPVIRARARRDSDVENSVIGRMRPIPSANEIGAFAEYHMYLTPNDKFHKVVFAADVVGNGNNVYDGATGNLRVNYFHPFNAGGRLNIGAIGFGMFFASTDFNNRYFGVTGSDVALFPTLGGREFRAESGLTSVKIPFSVTTQMSKQWLLTLGGRYERLMGDAKDSPVVDIQGDPNQWMLGFAVSYLY